MKRSLIFLLATVNAWAYDFDAGTNTYSTNGSQSDTQAAIDAAISAGTAGATILLDPGTHLWNTPGNGVTINALDRIHIRGAGKDVTIIQDQLNNTGTSTAVFNFQNYHTAGRTHRLSDLTIECHNTTYSSITVLTSAPFSRYTRVKVTNHGVRGSTRGFWLASTQGNVEEAGALLDECELYGRNTAGASQMISVWGNDYETPPTVGSGTKSAWYNDNPVGNFHGVVVFEDGVLENELNQDSTIETYNGGKAIVRHSRLRNFIAGAHGNDSSTRAGLLFDIHNNEIIQELGSGMPNIMVLRGGTGLLHNNTITESGGGSTYPVNLQLYRAVSFNLANGNPSLVSLTSTVANLATGRSYRPSTLGTTNWANVGAVGATAGSFVTNRQYSITAAGSTDFTLIGAANSNVGTVFTASGPGSGTGTAISTSESFTASGTGTGTGVVTNYTYVGVYNYNTGNNRYERSGDTSKYFAYDSGAWKLYGDGQHQLTHATELRADQVLGNYVASGVGDIVINTGGLVRIYHNNLPNGATPTDGNTAVTNGSGTHTGGSSATLTDATKSWTTNEFLGNGTAAFNDERFTYYCWNRTSGAGGFVTANTATTVTVALNGGNRQTFESGDSYVITTGYPGLDQVGRTGPTRFFDTYSTQLLNPVHAWNNTFNGSPDTRDFQISWSGEFDTTNSPRITELIVEGRDYKNNQGAPEGYVPLQYPHPLRVTPSQTLRPAAAVGAGAGF